jgi:hypothetical protein
MHKTTPRLMTSRLFVTPFILSLTILLTVPFVGLSQSVKKKSTKAKSSGASYGAKSVARDREIAATFAPIFYQGIGDNRRADLITNFDFDGDWRGDNNWTHADDKRFQMLAYVYYAVSETPTHFFIHYAVFHARDYKGGGTRGVILSEAIREGARRGGQYDPTGLSSEAVLAHENDMEGCLVVASKSGEDPARARVVYVETLGHDRFQRYAAEGLDAPGFKRFTSEGDRPVLYVEPKGHGVSAYDDERRAKDSSSKDSSEAKDSSKPQAEDAGGARERKSLVYRYAGRAGDAEGAGGEVGYELLSLYTTLWPRARRGANETFGVARDFGALNSVAFVNGGSKTSSRRVTLGKLGSAFRGTVGAPNAARPPWGWFDRTERDATPGSWFFDPAATVKRDFSAGGDFSLAYTHAPFLGVFRR